MIVKTISYAKETKQSMIDNRYEQYEEDLNFEHKEDNNEKSSVVSNKDNLNVKNLERDEVVRFLFKCTISLYYF